MTEMQKLAPKMQEIRTKYADDKEKMQQEMAKIGGFKAFGGCLPMFIQMPIWIALYGALGVAIIEETGKGFSDFLIDYRIERAKELLSLPDASIKQVSAACGYPDPNYFSRLFKKVTGLTPSNFSSGVKEANDENG